MAVRPTVYVPLPSAERLAIAPGSGIVGEPDASGARVEICYEGNIYGAANLRTYADRVMLAAGRLRAHAPTVARAWVKRSDLRAIGAWDEAQGVVELDDAAAAAALARWLGHAPSDTELLATGARFEMQRAVRAGLGSTDPAQRFAAQEMARRHGIERD